MPTAIRVSDELHKKARVRAKSVKRSVAGQIEYWAKIGEIAEDNPDLPYSLVRDILVGRDQARAGVVTNYVFGEAE